MSKIASARSALREGGAPELVRATRLWLAGRIYPGTIPQPRKAKAKPKPVPKQSASTVDHGSALAWFEGRRPIYEKLSAAVAPYVERDGVIFDVGGNIGYFTKVLAETTDFRGTAHLFEPVPNLVKLCEETLKDAPYEVRIHEFGLSNEDSTIDIFISADGNLGWNTIVAEKAAVGMVPVQIEVKTFNDAGIDDVPSFIKIDVEGAEYRVLRGMLDALERWERKPAILCEIGWGTNHPNWAEELEVFAALEKIGYQTVDLEGEPLVLAELAKTTDVLFLFD